jgi:hypothetical protein
MKVGRRGAGHQKLVRMQRMGRIPKAGWIVGGVIAFLVAALVCVRGHATPRVAWNALNDGDQYELLSLYPYLSKPDYYGHEILGRTIISDPAARDRLNSALQAGVRQSDGRAMSCFNPRHGIRVTRAGVTTDFVICFECRQVQVWRGSQMIGFFLISDSPKTVFVEVLKSAGVPLAPKER